MAAAAAVARIPAQTAAPARSARRRSAWNGTPEIYFSKSIDNSRLVKVEDPKRAREMRQFSIALLCLFMLVMTYAWQHFKAIEYGYKVEALRSQRDSLNEMNRVLRLEEASLRDPERIDVLARKLGLDAPRPGQVVQMDGTALEGSRPVMASAAPVSVIAVP